MTRTLILGGLMLALLAASAPAAPKIDRDRKGRSAYKTPQEYFEAFHKAREKNDFRTMVACRTIEAQKLLALESACTWLEVRELAGELTENDEGWKKYKPLFDVLDKHGLTKEATKDFVTKGSSIPKKTREAIGKLIKDPAGFLVARSEARLKFAPDAFKRSPESRRLTQLKIDGNKASGVVVSSPQGKEDDFELETREPIRFEKVNGGWRIGPKPEVKHDDEDS